MVNLDQPLEPDLITEILNYRGNYRDEEEEALCRRMVEELTPEEQELAARTSYVYWLVSTTKENGGPSEELRKRSAMKEARRHLVGRTYEKAMNSLRNTCKFREVRKVDRKPSIVSLPVYSLVPECFRFFLLRSGRSTC